MRTNVPPARKCRNSSARKVVASVQDKAATQAVGPAQAAAPVKVDVLDKADGPSKVDAAVSGLLIL